MADQSRQKFANIARPYALAAFEFAHEKEQLDNWNTFLASASELVLNGTVSELLNNPEIPTKELYDLFVKVLTTGGLSAEQNNFLMLLAQNKRLSILPEVQDLFANYCAQLEKISQIRMITATTVEKDYEEKMVKALTKRIKSDVTLQCDVDPAILGGAIIHIGDRVIDGSVKGKLSRLYQTLTG